MGAGTRGLADPGEGLGSNSKGTGKRLRVLNKGVTIYITF